MSEGTIRNTLTAVALAIALATIAPAQSPAPPPNKPWRIAQSGASSRKVISVVTFDEPQRLRACHVQSFTADKLVCSRSFGTSQTYLPQQILALILPGDGVFKLRLLLGFNLGLGASVWGTVVLAAMCPACAVATGVVALLLFSAAGGVLAGDDQPEHLLYLAPGEQLTGKLRFIQPL